MEYVLHVIHVICFEIYYLILDIFYAMMTFMICVWDESHF